MVKEKTSREKLIEENMGLVHSCARKFTGKGVDYDDLFQSGCIGLIKAADGFKEELGFSFSTYAVPAILGEIKKIFRDGGTVKVGRVLKEKAKIASGKKEELYRRLGREPTVSELAEELGMDIAETAQVLNASLPVLSLTIDDDEGGGQTDVPVPPPDEPVSDRIALGEVMRKLSDKDRLLIELRYFRGLTQTRTAAMLDMSQVQVSRREKKLLNMLREEML